MGVCGRNRLLEAGRHLAAVFGPCAAILVNAQMSVANIGFRPSRVDYGVSVHQICCTIDLGEEKFTEQSN